MYRRSVRYRLDMASLQREIQGYRQTLGMAPGQGLELAQGSRLRTEENEDDEEENDDDDEEREGDVETERVHTRARDFEEEEEEDEEDVEEEESASSVPTVTVQSPPSIQQQQQQIVYVTPSPPTSSSAVAVSASGSGAGNVNNPNDESSQQQQQLVRALMDQLQRVQAEAQSHAVGLDTAEGLAELTSRLRRAEARSIALDQQIQSMPPSLQVAQAEKRVSEARLHSALLACQQSLSSHTQLFESQRAEWRAMMTLKEEERRRLSAKVLSMKETVHQLTHHLHALQSQARAREELDQETDRISAAHVGGRGRGPGLGLESNSEVRLLAAEVQKERERLTPAPWAHALAPRQGLAPPPAVTSAAVGTRTTSAAFTATAFTAGANLPAPVPPPVLPAAFTTAAATTMFTPSHPSATPTITPSYQYVNNPVIANDGDTPVTVVPSYYRHNNPPNNNNNINDDNNNDLMGGMAMAALDHSLLSNTTTGNNHTITADNDGNTDADDRVATANSQDSDDVIKGDKPSLSNNNKNTKGTTKKKTKGKG